MYRIIHGRFLPGVPHVVRGNKRAVGWCAGEFCGDAGAEVQRRAAAAAAAEILQEPPVRRRRRSERAVWHLRPAGATFVQHLRPPGRLPGAHRGDRLYLRRHEPNELRHGARLDGNRYFLHFHLLPRLRQNVPRGASPFGKNGQICCVEIEPLVFKRD